MKIILNAHGFPPEWDHDCDCATLDATPHLLETVRRRMDLARQIRQDDDDLLEVYFWDSSLDYYDASLVEACQEAASPGEMEEGQADSAQMWCDRLEREGYATIPAGVELAARAPQRTECCQMIIRYAGMKNDRPVFTVAWTAIPKHTDIYVTTSNLTLAVLERCCGAANQHDRRESSE
jgi:hypothetical protein